jgi:hypothetical protein
VACGPATAPIRPLLLPDIQNGFCLSAEGSAVPSEHCDQDDAVAISTKYDTIGRCYLMSWMSQRAPGEAVMRSSPVTKTAPVSSARAT